MFAGWINVVTRGNLYISFWVHKDLDSRHLGVSFPVVPQAGSLGE